AKSLPLQFLSKHRDNLFQIEAMLFGQAGLLEKEFSDNYPKQLKQEYQVLKSKFSLQPIDTHTWKFMRLRPKNFPTIRIAQFAMLIHQSEHLFTKILEEKTIEGFYRLFKIDVSDYWANHFIFEKASKNQIKTLGKNSINNILINTVVPFLFVYGEQKGEELYKERAVEILEAIQGEQNFITKEWESIGVKNKSAFQSQALIELKNNYCDKKLCLNCAIGNQLMRN
ncbi:MAG: DUF2851 family protein, partial [Bacteroidetes bacterium]|nr:DUF2851 family protein [Bacteroidota bacterium]